MPTRRTGPIPRPAAAEPPFARVALVALDVDGVLTDGRLYIDERGRETKAFHARDGAGLAYLREAGIPVAFITGRRSPAARARAKELGVAMVVEETQEKDAAFARVCRRLGVPPGRACFVGDDLPDLAPMRLAGCPVAVADAPAEVRAAACYVTRAPGGGGAVREVAERVLRARGRWSRLLARYARTEVPRP